MFAGKSLSDSSFPFWSNDLGTNQWHDKEYECHRGNPRSPANRDAKILHNDFFSFPSSTFTWKQTLIEPDFTLLACYGHHSTLTITIYKLMQYSQCNTVDTIGWHDNKIPSTGVTQPPRVQSYLGAHCSWWKHSSRWQDLQKNQQEQVV